jgi:hypothetical protein
MTSFSTPGNTITATANGADAQRAMPEPARDLICSTATRLLAQHRSGSSALTERG